MADVRPVARVHYFRGRGLGEMVRFMVVACGYKLENVYVEEKEALDDLRRQGLLVADQLPLLELVDDNIRSVQSMASIRFLARKHGFYGASLEQDLLIDILADCVRDFLGRFTSLPFSDDRAAAVEECREKWVPKYARIFERALRNNPHNHTHAEADPVDDEVMRPVESEPLFAYVHCHERVRDASPPKCGHPVLVGTSRTYPDITLTEALLYAEEIVPGSLEPYPLLKAHLDAMSEWEPIANYLSSPLRNPVGDDIYRAAVRSVLG